MMLHIAKLTRQIFYRLCKIDFYPLLIKHIFNIGDSTSILHSVSEGDLASFETGIVHPFYSTFALGRDAEWACRQFVLEMMEEDEEGIGVFLNIKHQSPAFLGDVVEITAKIILLEGNAIDCSFEVKTNNRLVATGTQGQKILKKTKLQSLIESIKSGSKN